MVSIYLIAIVKLKGNVSIYEKEMVSICLKATVRRELQGNGIYLLDISSKIKRKYYLFA